MASTPFTALWATSASAQDGHPAFRPMCAPASAPSQGAASADRPEEVSVEAQIEAARAEAREQVLAELAERDARAQAQLVVAAEALEQAATLRREALHQASKQMGELVLAVVRRIVGESMALHPQALPGIVEAAIALLPERDEVTVRVAPDRVEEIVERFGDRAGVRVIGDASVTGGCRAQAGHAAIDASVEAALTGVAAAVHAWSEDPP